VTKGGIGRGEHGAIILPDDAVTQGFALLARRRSGKSNLAGVIEETFCERGDPWVVLDPVSAHWGIRYQDDHGQPGKPSGYEVMIVGGKYGDVALDEKGGAALAQILVDTNISCVVDLGGESMNAQQKFVADFATELLRVNETPRHVLLEEAHTFVPQVPSFENQKLVLGAMTKMITMGGGKGIGFTLITQRSASIAKAVLEQIDNLFVLRMSGPRDLKAVQDWFEHNIGDAAQMKAILDTLRGFAPGEAWWLSDTELRRLTVRLRRTYHAGRTPKRGETMVAPKRVDLRDVIGQYKKAAEKRAIAVQEERDLRAENAALRRQLAAKAPAVAPCGHEREIARLRADIEQRDDDMQDLNGLLDTLRGDSAMHFDAIIERATAARRDIGAVPGRRPKRLSVASVPRVAATQVQREAKPRAPVSAPVSRNGHAPSDLSAPQQRVINAGAALHAFGVDEIAGPTLAAHSGYRYSGGFRNILSELRGVGLLTDVRAKVHRITPDGISRADYEPIASADELRERWLALCSNSTRPLLAVLIDEYPSAIDGPELARRCGREYSGGFRNLMSELCTMSAAVRPAAKQLRAADHLFPEYER